jgi:hypothetical protein
MKDRPAGQIAEVGPAAHFLFMDPVILLGKPRFAD